MKKLIYFSVILFYTFATVTGQNIYSELHHCDSFKEDLRKNTNVKKIVQKTTFLSGKEPEIETTEIILNEENYLVTENRFNERYNRKTRLIVSYDSTHVKCLSRRIDINQPYVSSSSTSYYTYDENGFLTMVTDKSNNITYRQTYIVNNEKGHPIMLEIYENSQYYGKETADYDYENNSMKTTVFNSKGEIVSVDTGKINYDIKDSNTLKNEYGDVIQTDLFKFEYKYDKYGNWKKQIRYMMKNNNWVKNAIFERTLIYRK